MSHKTERFPINYGLRFFAASVLAVPGLFLLVLLLLVSRFEFIFAEMLGGAQLPKITQMLFGAAPTLGLIALAAVLSNWVVLFGSKREQFPFYYTGCVFVATSVLSSLVLLSLFLPFITIIKMMNA